jgi:hypothetical protein
MQALPVGWVEPVDISNAVLFLASDESRYIAGLPVTVDAASNARVAAGAGGAHPCSRECPKRSMMSRAHMKRPCSRSTKISQCARSNAS